MRDRDGRFTGPRGQRPHALGDRLRARRARADRALCPSPDERHGALDGASRRCSARRCARPPRTAGRRPAVVRAHRRPDATPPGTSTARSPRASSCRSSARRPRRRAAGGLYASDRRAPRRRRRRLPPHRRGPPARRTGGPPTSARLLARAGRAGTLGARQRVRHRRRRRQARPRLRRARWSASTSARSRCCRSVPTYDLADPRRSRTSLDRIDELVIKPRAGTAATASSSARTRAPTDLARTRRGASRRARALRRAGDWSRSRATRRSSTGDSSRATSTCAVRLLDGDACDVLPAGSRASRSTPARSSSTPRRTAAGRTPGSSAEPQLGFGAPRRRVAGGLLRARRPRPTYRSEHAMKALTWHGKARRPRRHRPRPDDRAADRRDHPRHLDRRSAARTCTSTRCSARSSTPGDILGHEPMGIVEAVGSGGRPTSPSATASSSRSTSPAGTAACASSGLQSPVRDDAEPRPGHGRRAVRLHEALRPGARRAGRVPARAAGPVRADQGPRGPARRPLPVPLRRAAHGLAGGAVRRRSPTAAASRSSVSDRSARCRRGSPSTSAPARSSASTSCPSGSRARRRHGVETIDVSAVDDVPAAVRELTDGRGPDAVDRRRRDGGARRARRQARAARSPGSCPTPSRAR